LNHSIKLIGKNLVFLKESIIEMKAESSCWCAKPKIDFNLKIEWKGGQRHYSDVAMGFKTFTCQQVCRSLALTSLQTNFFWLPWCHGSEYPSNKHYYSRNIRIFRWQYQVHIRLKMALCSVINVNRGNLTSIKL